MSEVKELELQEQKRLEEESFRKLQEAQLQLQIRDFEQRRQLALASGEQLPPSDEDGENDEKPAVELEEDSGLKNYFKEIVKNANRFGDKPLDMTQYSNFLHHYNRKEPTDKLEEETRREQQFETKRRKYEVVS